MATEGAESNPPVDPGVVYILENEAFAVPVVKIGKTGQQDWVARIKQLNTAVPLPFTCAKASRVDDMGRVEAFLHQTFFPAKRQWRGEFYEVEAWRVAQVLKIFETEDATNLVTVPDPEEEKAINTTVGNKEAKADFTFAVARIPVGTKLGFKGRPEIEAKVMDDKTTVLYEGEAYTMSALATKIKQKDYVVQGILWWTYDNETLRQRRDRMEAEADQQ
jgi:hypothetical protein